MTMSDPVPKVCKRCSRKVFNRGGGHVERDEVRGFSDGFSPPSRSESESSEIVSTTTTNSGALRRKQFRLSRSVSKNDLKEENTDLGRNYLKYGTHEQLRTRREARRREAIQRILEDTQIKTRDVWYYSTVLFLCRSMFLKVVALIVIPFSCHEHH